MGAQNLKLVAIADELAGVLRVVLDEEPAPDEAELAPVPHWKIVEDDCVDDVAGEDELDFWDVKPAFVNEFLQEFWKHAANRVEEHHTV